MSTVIAFDPTGEIHSLPTYPWRSAPEGLATRRPLSSRGLRPNGQEPVAQALRSRRRSRGPLVAYLYDIDLAAAKRPMTPTKWAAVATAVRSRRVCAGPCGRRDLSYIPPDRTGRRCFDCAEQAANPTGGRR